MKDIKVCMCSQLNFMYEGFFLSYIASLDSGVDPVGQEEEEAEEGTNDTSNNEEGRQSEVHYSRRRSSRIVASAVLLKQLGKWFQRTLEDMTLGANNGTAGGGGQHVEEGEEL